MSVPADPGLSCDLVVAYWGPADQLRELVESVLAQTDGRWRLTVVDDGYPDPWAGPYLSSLADARIAYVRNERNTGVTAVFRQCVALATAPVVALPGCDDVLLPDYVATVLGAMEREADVDVVQPGVRVIDAEGRTSLPLADRIKQRVLTPRTGAPLGGESLATSLMHGDWLYWPSLAFRRARIQGTPFRDDLPIALDLALVVDMLLAGARLLVEPGECFAYRRHSGSASSTALLEGARFAGERAYFATAREQFRARGWRRAARAASWHLTSRLHALTLLPVALRRRPGAVPMLLGHAVAAGSGRPRR